MGIAVVATVLNESRSLQLLLDSLAGQSRRPDEVVIVDGGSTDGTVDLLRANARKGDLPLRVICRPGSNIAQGRNVAIGATEAELVAVVDAGVRLEPNWLEELLRPFAEGNPPDVVGGFFVPAPVTLFERALGAVTLPRLGEIDARRFLPSSRCVAFRRAAWQAVGGYPEWLDYCEDLVYDLALREAGFVLAFTPRAVVHFRPRPSLRAFFVQYHRYARGDGKADLWRWRHLVRYITYLVGGPLLVVLSSAHHPLWLIVLMAAVLLALWRPVRRTIPELGRLAWLQRLTVLSWVPLIVWTGDVAKMLGYPAGIWWRWHHRPGPPWARRL